MTTSRARPALDADPLIVVAEFYRKALSWPLVLVLVLPQTRTLAPG
jgi:hypothetical protein